MTSTPPEHPRFESSAEPAPERVGEAESTYVEQHDGEGDEERDGEYVGLAVTASPPDGTPPPRRVLPIALGVVGAALIVVAAVAIPRALRDPEAGDPAQTGTRTGVEIKGLQVFTDLRTDHVETDVDYPQSPPAGGPHDPVWLACGAYDTPLRDENAVHDLEHGAVWIAYDPEMSEGDVAELGDELPQNGIMAPYPGLQSPVVVTVWERQLALDGADDPRLATFLQQFGAGETSPEPGTSCAGGTPDAGGEIVGNA